MMHNYVHTVELRYLTTQGWNLTWCILKFANKIDDWFITYFCLKNSPSRRDRRNLNPDVFYTAILPNGLYLRTSIMLLLSPALLWFRVACNFMKVAHLGRWVGKFVRPPARLWRITSNFMGCCGCVMQWFTLIRSPSHRFKLQVLCTGCCISPTGQINCVRGWFCATCALRNTGSTSRTVYLANRVHTWKLTP